MKKSRSSPEAFRLFLHGVQALAEVEANGIRIDAARLKRTCSKLDSKIERFRKRLEDDDVWARMVKRFGKKANLDSLPQVGHVLFHELDCPVERRTNPTEQHPDGQPKMDEEALRGTGHPFAKLLIKLRKLRKARHTYLAGLEREVVDGLLHCFFNLHTVSTMRSSSDSLNFQNVPIRNPKIGELIRSLFVPRPGCKLIEIDFAALEFRIAACFWRDPAMIAYASDPDKDVHRDLAALLFLCKRDQVSGGGSGTRYVAKNQFVFPELYGSWYAECAKNIWKTVTEKGLLLADGTPVEEHLARKGVVKRGACEAGRDPAPGTFEAHVKDVEADFMQRFPTFASKKDRWYDEYRKLGGFRLMTGFWLGGLYSKNFCLNSPVQGPAFHILLWCLIELVWQIRKRKMRSKVVGQIHDSILGDVPDEEVQSYLDLVERIMTVDVRKAWNWIVTPLGVEADVAENNWFEKREWVRNGRGIWGPKEKVVA